MKHGKIWLTAAVLAALHMWGAVPGYAANSAQDGEAVTGAQTANATQIGNTAQTASVVQTANAAQAQQDYWDGFKHVPNYATPNAPRPVGGVSPTPQESTAAGNAASTESAAKQVTVTQEADGSTTVTIPPATQEPSALERARQSRAERIRRYSDSELWSSAYYAGMAAQRRYYYDYYWPRLWLDWDWHWGHHHHHHAPPPPRHGGPRGPRPGGPRR